MASKTDTSTAGRSAPAKGIPDPKIKRALEWIERLLTSVKKLKDRADNEQTHYCFSGWALDRENIAATKAVASSLESIDYPGAAARIRSFCESLISAGNEMLVLDDPAYVPVGAFSYRVGAASYDVAALERALLEVQDVVCRDAGAAHPRADQNGTGNDQSGGPVESSNETKRRGRLPKAESDAKRADMLATLRQHPSLKDDVGTLAGMVGVGESTVRRWLDEEQQKYLESQAARPEPAEE